MTNLDPNATTCYNLFFDDKETRDRWREKFYYGFLGPAAVLMVCFSFLYKRTHIKRNLCNGRGGIPIPIRLLEEQNNRRIFVAMFMIPAWTLLDLIFDATGSSVFISWHVPYYAKTLLIFASCLLVGIRSYPIFAGVNTNHPIGLAVAAIYTWCSFVFEISMSNMPCNNDIPMLWVFFVLNELPTTVAYVYLSIAIPWRFIRWFLEMQKSGEFLKDNRTLFQVVHVKEVLKRRSDSDLSLEKTTIVTIARRKIYNRIPGFRYSLSIQAAIAISLLFIYKISVTLWMLYYMALFYFGGILEDLTEKIFDNYAAQHIYNTSDAQEVLKYGREGLFWVMSAKYIGYQMGYAAWGYMIQAILILIVMTAIFVLFTLVIRYGMIDILTWFLRRLGPPLGCMVLILGVQNILVHFFFIRKDAHGNRVLAIDNRRAFANFQYFMVFTNAPLGLLACLLRIIKAIISGVWLLPRLDVSTMSRPFERYDNGFAAYVSLLFLENAQTNPVLIVFVNLLLDSIGEKRSTIKTRFAVKKSAEKTRITRRKLTRNRWCLFITLHNNPGLRLYRKNAPDISKFLVQNGISTIANTQRFFGEDSDDDEHVQKWKIDWKQFAI